MPEQLEDDRPLYHLALADEWNEAAPGAQYRRSTLGTSLEEQGFIHCSFAHQVQGIADLVYAGRRDVLLLRIDPGTVDAEIRVENLEGGDERFPHIYGPLPIRAVMRVDAVPVDPDGRLAVSELVGRD